MPKKFRTVGGRSRPKRSGYAKGMIPKKYARGMVPKKRTIKRRRR